ncbi:hypothetical protein F5880DRAFT_1510769 [Lentinula raphanica]|nr:hypothetical protein F5880DRAFT_1510769 [Lentinula raphanica]
MNFFGSGIFNFAHDFIVKDSAFNAPGRDVNYNYFLTDLSTEEEKKLQDWLAAPDCSTNYTTALNNKVTGTGQWIFKDLTYLKWKEEGSILWIQGKGSGKTFLIQVFKDCYYHLFHNWVLKIRKFILH